MINVMNVSLFSITSFDMQKIININFDKAAKEMTPSEVFGDELIVSKLQNRRNNSQRIENMPTIRLDAVTFFICMHGEISFHLDYRDYQLNRNMLLQLNRIHILNNVRMSNNYEGYMVAISPYLAQFIMSNVHSMKKASVRLERFFPLMELSESQMNSLIEIIIRIIKIMKDSKHAFQNHILKNEVSNFLLEIANINIERSQNQEVAYEAISYKEEVVQNFIHLVFDNCKKEHNVSFYAEKLCMTSGNLSRILKIISGKTTIKWISDTLIMESKILLNKPSVNIQEISEELHFVDQSSFGKFFKKNTGQTPTEFKNKIKKKGK